MNWSELENLTEPTWIDTDVLFKLMLSTEPMYLSGWASEGDPLFKTLEHSVDQHVEKSYYEETASLMGGVCMNNTVIVFLHDPSDGYRSYLNQALVVPNTTLTTTFSPVPVRAVPANTQDWDSPQREDEPTLLDLIALDIDKSVIQLGTSYSDSYYPTSVLYFDTKALDEAMPLAIHRTLTNAVGSGSTTKAIRKI